MTKRALATMLGVLLAFAPAVSAKPKSKSTGAVDAGTPAVGQRVMAPWGRYGKRYPGQITGQYGKFVEVKYDDGYAGWCEGDLTTPPVAPLPMPQDKNPYKEGQRVYAKWSLKGQQKAVVVDTYAGLTLVHFESDDRAWVKAGEIKAR